MPFVSQCTLDSVAVAPGGVFPLHCTNSTYSGMVPAPGKYQITMSGCAPGLQDGSLGINIPNMGSFSLPFGICIQSATRANLAPDMPITVTNDSDQQVNGAQFPGFLLKLEGV
jgi:hypothetical protein